MAISIDKVNKAVAQRALGYSMASISQSTGVSIRQLSTIFKDASVAKGKIDSQALQKAKDALFSDKRLAAELKRNLRLSINAEISVSNLIIDSVATALEEAQALPVERRAKVIASLAAATASTFNGLRKLQGIEFEGKNDELPKLTIVRMTQADIIEIQKEHQQFGSEDQDESDAEIVEEM